MLTISQIAAIIMLLTAFGVDPITTADVQRILEGRPAITSTATTTMKSAQPPASAPGFGNSGNGGPIPTAPSPSPVENGVGIAEPVSQARIDIINPLAGKGSNVPHSTSPAFDERGNPKNEMYIGAVLYSDDGEATGHPIMTVTATDASQNKTINGTGGVTPIYVNGQKRVVSFYSFSYEFKTVGEHVITFSANGISQSVTVTVSE